MLQHPRGESEPQLNLLAVAEIEELVAEIMRNAERLIGK